MGRKKSRTAPRLVSVGTLAPRSDLLRWRCRPPYKGGDRGPLLVTVQCPGQRQ